MKIAVAVKGRWACSKIAEDKEALLRILLSKTCKTKKEHKIAYPSFSPYHESTRVTITLIVETEEPCQK